MLKILWLKTELLHPVDKGGKIRTYQMLRHLKRSNDVTYLSLVTPGVAEDSVIRASEYSNRLIRIPWEETRKFTPRFYRELAFNLASGLPYALEKYRSTAMRREIEREVAAGSYDIVVCDFLAPSVNLPAECPVPVVLFQHNVEAVIWQRHYETAAGPIRKAFFHNQWKKMLVWEREACRRVDAVITVSRLDRDQIRNEYGVERVYDVPTGVDTEYFKPLGGRTNRHELVFTGSMDWMPNEDAILHFAAEILPKIRARIPDVTLTVVGRSPSERIRQLASNDTGITVTGRVEDIRPWVDRAAAYVVPIRVGGGTRLKLYEAMAMEKPVVSTTIGAEGLPVADGSELLIADDAGDFAEAVVRILTDEALRADLSRQAGRLVRERFGWDKAADRFAAICREVIGSSRIPASARGAVAAG